jgi:hypothetical protein
MILLARRFSCSAYGADLLGLLATARYKPCALSGRPGPWEYIRLRLLDACLCCAFEILEDFPVDSVLLRRGRASLRIRLFRIRPLTCDAASTAGWLRDLERPQSELESNELSKTSKSRPRVPRYTCCRLVIIVFTWRCAVFCSTFE